MRDGHTATYSIDARDLPSQLNHPTTGCDRCGERLVQPLKTAAEISQLRGPVVDARPEPGKRDSLRRVAELGAQERIPDHVCRAIPHLATDPRAGADAFKPIRA